jgi:hypothetical protein
MSFDELKEKLVSYYPRNITFFGWDLFTRLKLQQTPKLTQEQVQEAVQNATLEQKLQMAEAYRRAENELQKTRAGLGFLGIAFIGGAGAYTLIKRRFPHKIIVPGLLTLIVNGSWLYHEPSYIGTYAEEIRPVIDKIYEEVCCDLTAMGTHSKIFQNFIKNYCFLRILSLKIAVLS